MPEPLYAPPPVRPIQSIPVSTTDQVECLLYDLDPESSSSAHQLFLAHATGLHGRVYRPLAERLSDYHCWTADLRGHGDATSPNGHRYDWQGFADDLVSLLAAMPPSATRVAFGHSMGAAILLRVELQNPGTFSALYCFEPIVPIAPLPLESSRELPLVTITRKRRNAFPDRAQAYANYASKPPLEALHPDCLSAYVEWGFRDLPDGSIELKLPGNEEAEVYSMSGSHDTFAGLSQVTCPVAVAHGALETMTASAWAEEIARSLPRSELLPFPDLGHFGPLQAPDRIARSMRGFFERSL